MLRRALALVATLLTFTTPAQADPYPPYWQGGAGSAIHFQPVAWPSNGAWRPYTSGGVNIADKRDNDPSNGGTSPQGYVNVSSGCTDTSSPSIYYAYDATAQVLFFRWRVQAPPHNYATGPSAGSFSSTSPWQSALWTVMIDLNGDGYRDFAVHLDGSSGAPAAQVDRLAAIYSRTLTHSLDYIGDPSNIALVKHNPTAFVDQASSRILNFQNSLTPTINWPNGAAETNWDYGTTRATLLNTGCGEYFIDYQIPLAMLDATAVGGPAITPATPMSLFFTTSNSLTNPLQKDAVTNGAFVAGTGPLPFGDTITPGDGTIPQPLVLDTLKVTGCGPASVSVDVMDARTTTGSTVTGVDFSYLLDANGNGLPDEGGAWTSIGAATLGANGSTWTYANWSTAALAKGQYLIGAAATDAQSNVTYSYLDSGNLPGASPPNFANASPVPGLVYRTYINSCGLTALSMTAALSASAVGPGDPVTMTLTVTNDSGSALDVSTLAVPLPAGFSYAGTPGGSLGAPGTEPTGGATGTITFGSFAAPTVPAGGSRTLTFVLTAPTTPGSYAMIPTGTTTAGAVTANAVTLDVGAPALTVSATPSTALVTPGTPFTVTASYVNTGTATATNGSMVMTIPAGFTPTDTSGGTWDPNTRTITWPVGTLGGLSGGQRTVTLLPDAPYAGSITPTFPVQLTADGPLTANGSAAVTVNVPGTALGVDITLTNGDPNVAAGASVPMRIYYANASASSASNAQLTLAIPSGFTFASAANGGTHSSGTVTWNLGTLAGSATGYVDVVVTASSPWTGLINPATFLATLSATSATSATDTQNVGVDYATGNVCSTYFFRNQFTAWNGALKAATIAAPTSLTATSISTTATSAAGYVDFATFYQDPVAPTDVTFSGTLTTYFYASKSNGPQLFLRARVYDYNPSNASETLLGEGSFSDNGNATNTRFEFPVAMSGTLAKGHALKWVFAASSNNSIAFTFLYDGTASAGGADYCVTPPATPVIDHDVTPLLGPTSTSLTYVTHFGNIGRSNMTSSTVNVALPDGVTANSVTLNGNNIALPSPTTGGGLSTYSFNVRSTDTGTDGQVTGLQSGVIQIAATLNGPSSPLTSTATLASTQTAGISDTAVVRLVEPTLGITITASTNLAAPGDTVTYTAVVTNTGAVAASGVTLTTALPVTAYYTYVTDSPTVGGSAVGGESFSTPTLTIPVGSIAPGASAIVTWQMRVANSSVPDGTTPHSLSAAVADSGSATASSNTVVVNTVTVPAIDVQITASGPNTPAEAGDVITVTATITSTGGATANGVVFDGPIFASGTYVPGSLTLDAASMTDVADGDAASFSGAANAITAALGNMAPGAVKVVTWQVRLDGTLASGSNTITASGGATSANAGTRTDAYGIATTATATMTALLSAPESVSMPVATLASPASGTSFDVPAGTPVKVGDVIIVGGTAVTVTAITGNTVTVDQSVTAGAGSQILPTVPYVATCTNTGTAAAASAVLAITLPGGTTVVSSTAGSTGSIQWALGSLAPGATALREVRVSVASSGDITGTVSCTFSGQATPATDSAVTAVGGVVLTKLTTTATPVAGAAGLEATYTITATNQRSTAANGMVITDLLSPGLAYAGPVSVTGASPSGMPVVGSRELEWSGFSIPANSSVAITFKVALGNLAPGTYQNMAAGTSTNSSVTPFDETASIAEDITINSVLGNDATVQITAIASAATVTLTDLDLDTDPNVVETIQVIVTNAATGEQETITLTETGPATGVFTAQLPLATVPGAGANNSGSMNAIPGQTLSVSYVDPFTSIGSPITVADAAVLPGTPSAPAITTTPTTLTWTQGDGPTIVDPGLVITPGSSATLASATIQVCTGYVSGQDVLSFTPLHGITGTFNPTTGTLSLTGTATIAQYQEVLRTVTYTNTATPPTDANRGVCFQVSDGSLSSQVASRTVNVDPAPTAPAITTTPTTLTYTGGNGAVVVDPGLTVTAGTSPTLALATIQVCTGYVSGEDVLSFTPMHGITGSFNASTGTLTLTGTATIAQYQQVLRTVTYSSTATPTTDANRGVCFQVSDGTRTSQVASRVIDVNPAPQTELSYYLTEGAKNAFLRTTVFIANPTALSADVRVDFYSGLGERHTLNFALPAGDRRVLHLEDYAQQLTDTAVSTVVTSVNGVPLMVEREVEWGENGYGAHAEQAATQLSTRLYFSEGAKDPFSPYLVVLNPGAQDAAITIRFLNADGSAVDTAQLVARAGHRETFDLRVIAAEASQAFGMVLESTQPIAAEHAMYMHDNPTWQLGHGGGATITPRTKWYFSEGTTFLNWDTFVLLANPGNTPATVTVQYHIERGPTVTRTYAVGAGQRFTANVAWEDPLLAYDHFWIEIDSDQPVVAERSMYWTRPWQQWTEGHSSPAMAAPRTEWGFGHGREGLARQNKTYLLFANPNDQPNSVTLRVKTATGERTSTIVIPANDRLSYHVGIENPLTNDLEFWMYLNSESNLPFLVERSLYWSSDGRTWTTGTNVTGIPIELPQASSVKVQ